MIYGVKVAIGRMAYFEVHGHVVGMRNVPVPSFYKLI
jgi:hypothetical protein